MPQMLDKY